MTTLNQMLYGDIPPAIAGYLYNELLERAIPEVVTELSAKNKPFNKNMGKTCTFTRYLSLDYDPDTSRLMEGQNPDADELTKEDITATIEQFGRWVPYTDQIEILHPHDIKSEIREILSEQMPRVREKINIAYMSGGTNVFYTNGSARTDVNTPITNSDLKLIRRSLRGSNAMFFRETMTGSTNFNTAPIAASFIFYAHTDCEADIRALNNFIPEAEYGSRTRISEYEIGECEGFRFVLTSMFSPYADGGGLKAGSGTTMLSTTGTSADVYPGLIISPNAWATIPLRGNESGRIVGAVPKPMVGDELGLNGFMGWKFFHTAAILNDNLMARLEMAATDTPA